MNNEDASRAFSGGKPEERPVAGRNGDALNAAPAGAAAGEQSGSYVYPDNGGAASSQRLRLVPPDGKPAHWWQRHREKLGLVEMVLTGLFFVLTLYFLFLWFFA